jgi:hypothetical protein
METAVTKEGNAFESSVSPTLRKRTLRTMTPMIIWALDDAKTSEFQLSMSSLPHQFIPTASPREEAFDNMLQFLSNILRKCSKFEHFDNDEAADHAVCAQFYSFERRYSHQILKSIESGLTAR